MARLESTLSEETIQYLESAKPAKPRRFVMVTKGANVLSLVIFKKGNLQNYIKEAKEAGSGLVSYGVFSGSGKNVVFQLAKADGFEAAPVKNQVLKSFLAEKEIDLKPVIELVDVLPPVPDADDPAPSMPPETASSTAPTTEVADGKIDDRAEKLSAAVAKLRPLLTAVIASQPQQKTDLVAKLKSIVDGIHQSQFDEAEKQLIGLAKRLKELQSNTPTVSPTPGGSQASVDRFAQAYQQLSDRIEPKYRQALAGQLGDTSKFRAVMGYAMEQATGGAFEKAMTALQRLEPHLDDALSGASGKETDVIAPGLVAERTKFLQSRWQAAISDMTLEVEKLRKAIKATVPDEDADEIADEVQAVLDDFCEDLNDAILATDRATAEDMSSVSLAIELVRDYRKRIKSHAAIQFLQQAPQELGADASSYDVSAVFLVALDELDSRLAS